MSPIKVYLAGGFKSNWQEKVREALPQLIYFDPRQHNLQDPKQYTQWDIDAIEECDIVFAYMEQSNPAGYALALEIGYAKGFYFYTDKIVILIHDDPQDGKRWHYFEMVHQLCDYVFVDIDSGITCLKGMVGKKVSC